MGEEGRVAWALALAGHPRVAVLDGGMAAWRAAGRPLAVGPAGMPSGGPRRLHPRAPVRARLDEVRAHLGDSSTVLLDVRSPAEFARGHLPGARNLEWRRFFDPGGRVLPRARVAALLTSAGSDGGQRIVAYCTSGVRSAMVWLVLASLGYDVRSYDGAWDEWSSHAELPVRRE
jgi:thiosulfate/3-mercaptopyruvate sulfurtransferase